MTADTGSRGRRGASRVLCVLVVLAIALMSSVSSRAVAQAVYGSISGTVSDATGGVLPGATVVVTSVERKTVDTVIANESGFYVGSARARRLRGEGRPSGLQVGGRPEGYRRRRYAGAGDFKLEVGSSSEEITVTGGAPLLKTDRADVATRFDTKELTELPVLDRNFTKFILLTPGAQQLGWQHAASENPQGSTQIQINGQSFSGTGYQLDAPRIVIRFWASSSSTRRWSRLASPESRRELRRRVRSGHRGCRLGSDEIGHQRVSWQRVRVLPERGPAGAQPLHAGRG